MKKMCRLFSVLMIIALMSVSFAGCKSEPVKHEEKENVIDDNYRNYYHIFVYSFADGNGDGIGDLKGITDKLDYIDEMGFNGIWLSPVNPSTTYHKYDVTDYYGIDKEYGTMEDFDKLIEECSKRNIKVILDLVFNHTSAKHPWFEEMCLYINGLKEGETPDASVCKYVDYYNVVETEGNKLSGYYKIGSGIYSYEGKFWDQMPDLNLGNTAVREEIEKIAKFWIDKGVGGFRIDAAKEFYSGSPEKNIEVLKWFSDYVKGIDEDLYLVAEVWDTHNTIAKYYESGITSIFDYCYADSSGYIISALNNAGNGEAGKNLAERFVSTEKAYLASNPNMINAPFLSNHDIGRIAGFTKRENGKIKLAAALNQFMGGSSFVYYGEEIGMTGAGKDENKRAPMYWSDEDTDIMCKGPADMGKVTHKLGSLETQEADKNSLYWYYRDVLHIRNMYPEIARGTFSVMSDITDGDICAVEKTYGNEKIYILINISDTQKEITVSNEKYDYKELKNSLTVDENKVSMKGEKLVLPPYAVAILK